MLGAMLKCLGVGVLAVAVGLGFLISNTLKGMSYDKPVQFQDASCRLLELPTPAEDLSAVGDGHCVFAGGGDLWNTILRGSRQAKQGAVWLVNATAGTVRQLDISGRSVPSKLVLHGIYYSRPSRRLYAVNHDEDVGDTVEAFDVAGGGASVALTHVLTVRSPLFGNLALNDVVEGHGEIYVTEWQPFPMPQGGKFGASDAPLSVKLQRAAVGPIGLAKLPLTRVFRCTVTGEPECTVASSQRFVGANGIAVTEDRQTVFVNDPQDSGTISVMERLGDGSLSRVSQFKTKHILDNIEMSADGKLAGGSIPLPYTSKMCCDEAPGLSASKLVGGREVGCGKSPGGLLDISLLGTGGNSFVDGTQVDKAMHDGSLLSGVSAALQVNSRIVMGSPNSPGVLLCDG